MKRSKAEERLSDEELLGGSVCIGCHGFTMEGERSRCSCPVGALGVYTRCEDCGDVYLDDSGLSRCVSCENDRFYKSARDAQIEHTLREDGPLNETALESSLVDDLYQIEASLDRLESEGRVEQNSNGEYVVIEDELS